MLKGKLTYICGAGVGAVTIIGVIAGLAMGRLETGAGLAILAAGLAFAGGFIGLRRAIANGK